MSALVGVHTRKKHVTMPWFLSSLTHFAAYFEPVVPSLYSLWFHCSRGNHLKLTLFDNVLKDPYACRTPVFTKPARFLTLR